jgi:hypothetical protein
MPSIEHLDNTILAILLAVTIVLLAGSVYAVRSALRRGVHRVVVEALRTNIRRTAILLAGTAVILVGIAISPLPGPGLSVLGPLGLAIIATEFVWARRLIRYVDQNTKGFQGTTEAIAARSPRWLIPPVWAAYWAAVLLLAVWTKESVPAWVLWPLASLFFTPIFFWSVKTWRFARRRAAEAGGTPEDRRETE